MKKFFLTGLIAFAAGAAASGILLFYSMDSFMMLEDESGLGFEATVESFTKNVEKAGWTILETHDMREILASHGHEVRPVKIFELCSAKYSAEILSLSDERIVSPLMPCRVAVYEKADGRTYISRMNSILMAKPFGGDINRVMSVAGAETEDIILGSLR